MGVWSARQVWREMPRTLREQAALALWTDEQLDRTARLTALLPWLNARGLRMQYLEKLARSRRAVLMAQGGVPEETASQLLISFHLVHRRELLSAFLDTLKIPHEGGLIDTEEEIDPPDAKQVKKAIGALRKKFPEGEVELYLRTLTATDAHVFAAVAEHVEGPD